MAKIESLRRYKNCAKPHNNDHNNCRSPYLLPKPINLSFNILYICFQAIPQTQSLRECKLLCDDNSDCIAYTYFGEQNVLRHLCLLYSSCEALAESGEDCMTGSKDCTVCRFEDTVDGQCGKKKPIIMKY